MIVLCKWREQAEGFELYFDIVCVGFGSVLDWRYIEERKVRSYGLGLDR